jgi:hypothetical protein
MGERLNGARSDIGSLQDRPGGGDSGLMGILARLFETGAGATHDEGAGSTKALAPESAPAQPSLVAEEESENGAASEPTDSATEGTD